MDTDHQIMRLNMGNSDTVGSLQFSLANPTGQFSQLTVSGNAVMQLDAMLGNSVVETAFRGTIERTENEVTYDRGSVTKVFAYDFGQELLGLLSPDARIPSALQVAPLSGQTSGFGVVSVLRQSGDQGMATSTGQDLVLFVSGANLSSGVTVASFMSQFYGTASDHTGAASGQLFSFKPYFSGMVVSGFNAAYRTWYYPDSGALGGDLNNNYWMPLNAIKVKRQYAGDVLKKMTRMAVPIDVAGNKVQFESYVGVSGDIHIFTSGSNEFFASGVVFQFYPAGTSGAPLNNIVTANIPLDTTMLKNIIVGQFPVWTQYPLDGDSFTDIPALSGGYWVTTYSGYLSPGPLSGSKVQGFLSSALSGFTPGTNAGLISIMATGYSGATGVTNNSFALQFNCWQNLPLNKFNVVYSGGVGYGVALGFLFYQVFNNAPGSSEFYVYLYDTSGRNIYTSTPISTTGQSGWAPQSLVIFGSGGILNSSVWSVGLSGLPNMNAIDVVQFILQVSQAGAPYNWSAAVDQMAFSFSYPFSPIEIYNSGSIAEYGARYETFEYPYMTTDLDASGIITSELLARQAPKQVAKLVVRDNPAQSFSYQLGVKPGQIFVIDAPTLNTGSGQTFYYWRATSVEHDYDTHTGFETTIQAYPWFSGTSALTAYSGANIIDYQLPVIDSPAVSRRSDYLPTGYVGYTP